MESKANKHILRETVAQRVAVTRERTLYKIGAQKSYLNGLEKPRSRVAESLEDTYLATLPRNWAPTWTIGHDRSFRSPFFSKSPLLFFLPPPFGRAISLMQYRVTYASCFDDTKIFHGQYENK